MDNQNNRIINKYTIIASILIACLLCSFLYLLQIFVFPNFIFPSNENIDLQITSVSTDLYFNEVQNKTPTSVPGIPEPGPGVFEVGMHIEISGTGEDGLRMRAEPGINEKIMFIADEGTQHRIVDGPVIMDSLIWWKIRSIENDGKEGWSVQDYFIRPQD